MAIAVDTSNAHFAYPKLDERQRQIRLLTLRGRQKDGLLKASLAIVSLDEQLQYKALSYVWGAATPTHSIIVNGARFMIRSNLHHFLNTVGAKKLLHTRLFVDAICVDQANLAERNSQVALMRNVYLNASEVIAWLGLPPRWMDTQVSWYDLRHIRFEQWGDFILYLQTLTAPSSGVTVRGLKLSTITKQYHDDLTHIYASLAHKQPFWTRLWVLQELLLARSLTVYFGARSLDPRLIHSWATFLPALGDIDPSSATTPCVIGVKWRYRGAGAILSHRLEVDMQGPYLLYELLITYCVQNCVEPRDHVFALLGLAISHIVPDYSLSMTQLYLHVLVEGTIFIAWKNRQPSQYRQRLRNFYLAAMIAFGFSASQTTVYLVMRTAMQIAGPRYLLPGHAGDLQGGMCDICWATNDLQRSRDSGIRYWVTGVRMQALEMLVPSWALMLQNSWLAIHIHLIHAFQNRLLAKMQSVNCIMAMPDGQVRTYSEWVAEVRRVTVMVKNGQSPKGPPASEVARFYPLRGQQHWILRFGLLAKAEIGLVVVYAVNLLMGLISAVLGVWLGAWMVDIGWPALITVQARILPNSWVSSTFKLIEIYVALEMVKSVVDLMFALWQ